MPLVVPDVLQLEHKREIDVKATINASAFPVQVFATILLL